MRSCLRSDAGNQPSCGSGPPCTKTSKWANGRYRLVGSCIAVANQLASRRSASARSKGFPAKVCTKLTSTIHLHRPRQPTTTRIGSHSGEGTITLASGSTPPARTRAEREDPRQLRPLSEPAGSPTSSPIASSSMMSMRFPPGEGAHRARFERFSVRPGYPPQRPRGSEAPPHALWQSASGSPA